MNNQIDIYLNPYLWEYKDGIYKLEIQIPGIQDDAYLSPIGVTFLSIGTPNIDQISKLIRLDTQKDKVTFISSGCIDDEIIISFEIIEHYKESKVLSIEGQEFLDGITPILESVIPSRVIDNILTGIETCYSL